MKKITFGMALLLFVQLSHAGSDPCRDVLDTLKELDQITNVQVYFTESWLKIGNAVEYGTINDIDVEAGMVNLDGKYPFYGVFSYEATSRSECTFTHKDSGKKIIMKKRFIPWIPPVRVIGKSEEGIYLFSFAWS